MLYSRLMLERATNGKCMYQQYCQRRQKSSPTILDMNISAVIAVPGVIYTIDLCVSSRQALKELDAIFPREVNNDDTIRP
jgi:hypothetical protein